MPVTGNNVNITEKIMSIQLRQGGLSFYVTGDEKPIALSRVLPQGQDIATLLEMVMNELRVTIGGDYDKVHVFIDTANTVFVPKEMIDTVDPEIFLTDAGIEVQEDDAIIVTESVDGICAVMAFDKSGVKYLLEEFDDRVGFYSPLHEVVAAAGKSGKVKECMIMYPTTEDVYIIWYDKSGRLTLAEVYPCSGVADVLYYATELTVAQRGANTEVMLYGALAQSYASVVRKYCKKVTILQ